MDRSEWVQFEANLKARYDACSDAAATPSSILLAVLNAVADVNRAAPPPPAEQASVDELECIAQAAAALDVMGRKPLAAWLMRTHAALSQRPVVDEGTLYLLVRENFNQHMDRDGKFITGPKTLIGAIARSVYNALAPQQPEKGEG